MTYTNNEDSKLFNTKRSFDYYYISPQNKLSYFI
jgi:hypothetical protein